MIMVAIAKCLWLSRYKQDMLGENIGDKIIDIACQFIDIVRRLWI